MILSHEMIIEVKENGDGELYIELPPELLEKMGWSESTINLVLTVEDNGTVILREKDC